MCICIYVYVSLYLVKYLGKECRQERSKEVSFYITVICFETDAVRSKNCSVSTVSPVYLDLVVLYVYFPALENVPPLKADKTRLNIIK